MGLLCSGPSPDVRGRRCWKQRVSGGPSCSHCTLPSSDRESSVCHFASSPGKLTSHPFHLHPNPNSALPSRDSHPPNLCGVLLAVQPSFSYFHVNPGNSSEWLGEATTLAAAQVQRHSSGRFIPFPKVTVSKW